MSDAPSWANALSDRLKPVLERAYVPYSGHPVAVALLLDDGAWIPGVRVESASFSLTVPALLNAYTTAVALGRADAIRGLVASRAVRPEEQAYLQALPQGPFRAHTDRAFVRASPSTGPTTGDGAERHIPGADVAATPLSPLMDVAASSPGEGIAAAQAAAQRAYVPSSRFPVGAALHTAQGPLLPGANVEHDDWTRILCAERSALGTAWSYGMTDLEALYLSCPLDAEGTPCGACRQLIAELIPEATLWMDRHDAAPHRTSPSALLPSSFRGRALPQAASARDAS
jgi:homotetrameric cytidine deaminase